MAKYSTNSGDGTDDSNNNSSGTPTNCEMCGKETDDLEHATIAGASLAVCDDCNPDNGQSNGRDDSQSESDRAREVIRKATENPYEKDRSWVEDTQYSEDQLPYLKNGYEEIVQEAREERGLTQGELADMVQIGIRILRVIENGHAATEGVGRSEFESLEQVLEVELIEEVD